MVAVAHQVVHSVQAARKESAVVAAKLKSAGVSVSAAKYAAAGYVWAENVKGVKVNQQTLAVVDFMLPSDKKRLYLVNLESGKLIGKYYVAHGSHSGSKYATQFSNQGHSHESSLGVFQMGKAFSSSTAHGRLGPSEKMTGLEKGINSNARDRGLVLHPARYVSETFIASHGRAGRSWGCFALSPKSIHSVVKALPSGTILYAYAKQAKNDKNLKSLV